jgi:hypothetical protein
MKEGIKMRKTEFRVNMSIAVLYVVTLTDSRNSPTFQGNTEHSSSVFRAKE